MNNHINIENLITKGKKVSLLSLGNRLVDADGGMEYLKELYQSEADEQRRQVESGFCSYNPEYQPLVEIYHTKVPVVPDKIYQYEGRIYNSDTNRMIANFEIKIINVIHHIGTDKIDLEFDINIYGHGSVRKVLPIAEFRKGKWLKDCFGIQIQGAEGTISYLEALCDNPKIPHINAYPVPGWYQEETGVWDYITEDGDIAREMVDIVVKQKTTELKWSALSEEEIAYKFLNHMRLTTDLTALAVMCFTVLADLYSIFKYAGYMPRFLLALVGPRAKGKTQLALLLTQLVNRKTAMSAPITFSTTELALEEAFGIYKDSVILIDDYMPSQSKSERENNLKLLERVSRIFGDGTPRLRSENYCESHLPQGLAIITAEYLDCCESSMTRHLRFCIVENTVRREIIGELYKELEVLPSFLWNLNSFVIQNQKEIIKLIRSMMEELTLNYTARYERMGMHVAFLETAYQIMMNYMISVGIAQQRLQSLQVEFHKFLIDVVQSNVEEIKSSSPLQLILNTLRELFDNGKFIHIREQRISEAYMDDSYLYFKRVWLLRYVKQYAAKRGLGCAVVNDNDVRRELVNGGFLVPAKEGDATKYSVRIPGAEKIGDRHRYYRVRITSLNVDDESNV